MIKIIYYIFSFAWLRRKKKSDIIQQLPQKELTEKEIEKQRIQKIEEECRNGFRSAFMDCFKSEKFNASKAVKWKTILVCDKKSDMGRLVELDFKGRDQSQEWESIQEKRDRMYKEGIYFKPKGDKNASH